MASPKVPTELVDIILENLANDGLEISKTALRSFCLAGKALVPLCQKRLFREVVLQPDVFEMPTGLVESRHNITRLFAKLVQERPHLADYVRHLTYRYSNGGEVGKVVEEALKKLRLVSHLELHVENPWETGTTYFSDGPRHAQAILSLVQRPQLRTLVLRNMELPMYALANCMQLRSIELDNATCFSLDKRDQYVASLLSAACTHSAHPGPTLAILTALASIAPPMITMIV